MKSLEECEEYLLNIPKFKKKTLLSDTKKFYEQLGSPGKSIPKIHVAGTNGKGSTCFYTSEILSAHGLKTGLFTSPHLVTMKERFVCNGQMISDEEFIEIFELIKKRCEMLDEDEKISLHPSFFEYLFLMFMEWMQRINADAIVLETGLGGALDATNIFDDPKVCVICSVGMDHMEQLGNTIESIAGQKAGIIKRNVPLVYLDNGKTVNDIFEEKAKEGASETYVLSDSNIRDFVAFEKRIAFSLDINYDNIDFVHDLSVSLPTDATYQRYNSSLALMASKLFLKDKFDEKKALKALSKKSFKGRFEEVADGIYVDGAHNEDALERLLESVKVKDEKRNLIFAACVDKNYAKMIERVVESELFDTIIFTRIDSPRSADPEEMFKIAENAKKCMKADKAENTHCDMLVTDSLAKAVEALPKNRKSYIAGSLYLVGEAETLFNKA